MHLSTLFWIGLGSALGGVFRYIVSEGFALRYGNEFPWGTIFVNVAGSFLIGLVGGLAGHEGGRALLSPPVRQFLMIGVLGGFTTFSSFSLQTLFLLRDGQPMAALSNVLLSVVVCLLAAWLGLAAGERIG